MIAQRAARGGDWVAVGNWYFHAKRRGSAEARVSVHNLRPQLEEAASLGVIDAKVLVAALLLDRGEELEHAAGLLEEAAQAGAVEGLRELGVMLNGGVGVPADPVRANELFRRAAEAGDGYAAFNLAVKVEDGLGGGAGEVLVVGDDLAGGVAGAQTIMGAGKTRATRYTRLSSPSSAAPY